MWWPCLRSNKNDFLKEKMGSIIENNRENYWDQIYDQRKSDELGWYQSRPEDSLLMIDSCKLLKSDPIIDIGGGANLLTDHLLDDDYSDLTVLDVSENALSRTKQRLKEKNSRVTWIRTDILDFRPTKKYELWHDRACFHFLDKDDEIRVYANLVRRALSETGSLIVAAFSTEGPKKCSGLNVKQYNIKKLEKIFEGFNLVEFRHPTHFTPSGSEQNYVFCRFRVNPDHEIWNR